MLPGKGVHFTIEKRLIVHDLTKLSCKRVLILQSMSRGECKRVVYAFLVNSISNNFRFSPWFICQCVFNLCRIIIRSTCLSPLKKGSDFSSALEVGGEGGIELQIPTEAITMVTNDGTVITQSWNTNVGKLLESRFVNCFLVFTPSCYIQFLLYSIVVVHVTCHNKYSTLYWYLLYNIFSSTYLLYLQSGIYSNLIYSLFLTKQPFLCWCWYTNYLVSLILLLKLDSCSFPLVLGLLFNLYIAILTICITYQGRNIILVHNCWS